jgi:AraC-like DNA-binding protein
VSIAPRPTSTVSGFALRQALAALRARSIDGEPLLKRSGLTDYDPDDRQRRISAVGQARFVELAAAAAGDTTFGLHLAIETNPREAGLLFYAAAAAKDVREALELFARYSRVANDTVKVVIAPKPGGVAVTISYVGISRYRYPQIVEFQFAILIKALREIAGRNISPTRVLSAHARANGRKEFDRFFGCPVEFTAPADGMDFSDETLVLPLVTSDRHLLETLRPFCEAATQAHPSAQGSLRASVENEIYRLLPHGRSNLETVARALGLSPRTLLRRLAAEGTSFARVIDALRHELALQYLSGSNFTIAQIAWLLGYEQPESFTHAFRRWTGRSPSQVRAAGK